MRFPTLITLLAITSTASAWTPNPDDPDGGGWPMPPDAPLGDPWSPEDPMLPLPGDLLDIPGGWDGSMPDFPLICVINVPDDYDTIQEAVDAAEDDCLILVAEDTYYENVVIDGKAVRIVGVGDVTVRPLADDAIFTASS